MRVLSCWGLLSARVRECQSTFELPQAPPLPHHSSTLKCQGRDTSQRLSSSSISAKTRGLQLPALQNKQKTTTNKTNKRPTMPVSEPQLLVLSLLPSGSCGFPPCSSFLFSLFPIFLSWTLNLFFSFSSPLPSPLLPLPASQILKASMPCTLVKRSGANCIARPSRFLRQEMLVSWVTELCLISTVIPGLLHRDKPDCHTVECETMFLSLPPCLADPLGLLFAGGPWPSRSSYVVTISEGRLWSGVVPTFPLLFHYSRLLEITYNMPQSSLHINAHRIDHREDDGQASISIFNLTVFPTCDHASKTVAYNESI